MRAGLAGLGIVAALAAGVALAAPVAVSSAQGEDSCFGEIDDEGIPMEPGPRLRFGINPAGEAGALGPEVPAVPDRPRRTLAALRELDARDSSFTIRLNRFFWADGPDGIKRFLRLADRYTSRGYRVELQLRYHPRPEQEGRIDRWRNFVRRVVRRFGPDERVVALQVTNEVNFYPIVPDASDSAYEGARAALVRGVLAARREADRLGFDHLKIGFNWAYRTDPDRERGFWEELRDRGGKRFVRALDWVGLDAYPGTVFPPSEPMPGDFRDGMVNAISTLRCLMEIPGIPERVPVKVEENGYPTGPARPESEQVRAMDEMVNAVHDFRGTYNVTDYRWFDLRDHRSASPNFQHHYGILADDYSPKPAFGLYERLVARLAR